MVTKAQIKKYIAEEFLSENDTDGLLDDLDLIETGILDSMAVLKLISYLEMECNITIDPEDLDPEKLNTIDKISGLVSSRVSA